MDDVLVDEQDIPAPAPPDTRLLQDIPARGTLLPDVCSSLLIFVEAYPTNNYELMLYVFSSFTCIASYSLLLEMVMFQIKPSLCACVLFVLYESCANMTSHIILLTCRFITSRD